MKLEDAICGIANEYKYKLDYIYSLYLDEFSMLCNYLGKKYKSKTGSDKLQSVDKALITRMKGMKKKPKITVEVSTGRKK